MEKQSELSTAVLLLFISDRGVHIRNRRRDWKTMQNGIQPRLRVGSKESVHFVI